MPSSKEELQLAESASYRFSARAQRPLRRSRKDSQKRAAPQGRKVRHTGPEAPLSCLTSHPVFPVWQIRPDLSVCPFWKTPDSLPPSSLSGRSASSAAAAPSSGSADSGTADLPSRGLSVLSVCPASDSSGLGCSNGIARPGKPCTLGSMPGRTDCPHHQPGRPVSVRAVRSVQSGEFGQSGKSSPDSPARPPCSDRLHRLDTLAGASRSVAASAQTGQADGAAKRSWSDCSVRLIGQPDQTDTSARTNLCGQVGKPQGDCKTSCRHYQSGQGRQGQAKPANPARPDRPSRVGSPLASLLSTGQPTHNGPATQNSPCRRVFFLHPYQ